MTSFHLLYKRFKEKKADHLFKIFISIKASYGLIEIAIGSFLLFANHRTVYSFSRFLVRKELIENPTDWLANHFVEISENLKPGTQKIIAIYLLTYGIIKLIFIYEVFKDRIRFYPYALSVFCTALLYMMYKLFTNFTWFMLLLAIFEAITIYLTWIHYQNLKRVKNRKENNVIIS